MECDLPSVWVRVIIVNYNAGAMLTRCIAALAAQTFATFEAVIVDNTSTDGSIEALRLPDTRFRVLRAGANLGFAAANNLGAVGCAAPWIAVLNPDAFAAPDWLERWHAATLRHPDTAMFGATQLMDADPMRLDGAGDCYSILGLPWRGGFGHPASILPPEGEVFAPCAAAALYRSDAFRTAGGFDARLFCFLEDVDLAFRLRLAGHRCIQVPDAVVRHVGSAITGRDSDFPIFHSIRNRIWIFVRNMPGPLLLLLGPGFAAVHLYLFARALGQAHQGAFARGLLAGLRGAPLFWRDRLRGGTWRRTRAIARALSWSLRRLARRLPDVRPVSS